MTGCLYAAPERIEGTPSFGVFPIFVADTLVTLHNPPAGAAPVIPATATSISAPSTTRLRRKLHIIGDSVLACAGDGQKIEYFLRQIEIELPTKLRELDAPMQWVASVTDRFNDQRGGAPIEVLGCCRSRTGNLDTAGGGVRFTTKRFGQCAAIGSGSNDLMELCLGFDQNAVLAPDLDPTNRAIGLARAISNSRLSMEVGQIALNRWGGYVEWAYYDQPAQKWRRAPKTLHLFYVARPSGDGRFVVEILPRAVAYEPGEQMGRVLSLSTDPANLMIMEFLLEGLTNTASSQSVDSRALWSAWKPEICSVSLTVLAEGIALNNWHRSLVTDTELEKAIYKYDPGGEVIFGINQPFHNELFREMLEMIGLKFKPMDKVYWNNS